jgi:hypothetical protein
MAVGVPSRRWTVEWLQPEVDRRAVTGDGRALAIFEALDEWFDRPDYEGCSFIKTLLEVGTQTISFTSGRSAISITYG